MGGGSREDLSANDIFHLKKRLDLPPSERVEHQAKYTTGHNNYFAIVLHKSSDLLLVCDGTGKVFSSGDNWSLKHVPWFSDSNRGITAVSFDEDGLLYIGTCDGSIYELSVIKILKSSGTQETDLNLIFHLSELTIENILIWTRDRIKVIVFNGGSGRLGIITTQALPVLVTFNCSVIGIELFLNKTGLTCALVCLENGQNVYTVLDDLELPPQNPEFHGKKSIFRKAKDNIMSKLSDEKMNFFGRKSKEGSPTNSSSNMSANIVSATAVAHVTTNIEPVASPAIKTVSIPLNNVKFQTLEEVHCRGLLEKVSGQSQFIRHVGNKLDIFDGDFRQMSAVFIPSYITKLFVINKLFYGIDEEHQCVRVSLIHSGMLKEFAVISFVSKILSIQAVGELESTSCSVFFIAVDGIHEMCLKKSPMDTCVDLLLKETNNTLLEIVCNALYVPKNQVCIFAGDMRAEEGKFAKTILFYKLAGMTYAKICAKFGSRGHIPAMLCFYDLVDQERTKLAGTWYDKQTMADIVLLGRIEQFLRHGQVRSALPRNPKFLLKEMLKQNTYYSSSKAANFLCIPELLWALHIVGKARMCFPEILASLQEKFSITPSHFVQKRVFWELITSDWIAVYTASPKVFFWFRDVVIDNLRTINRIILHRLLELMLPWRRELQRKIFTEISDLAEIIDFTITTDAGKVVIDDFVVLFITLILEVLRRKEKERYVLTSFVYKSDARALQNQEIANHKNNMVATMMLSNQHTKSFSASPYHCASVRNGKVYAWGENKGGRLGIPEDRNKVSVDTPTCVNLSPTLRVNIESVSCGTAHTLALTNFGTILVFGNNTHGQLGLGRHSTYANRPVPLDMPNVIFNCIAAGGYHSVAIDHLYRVWTWGWGVHGQLGNDSVENKYYPQLLELEDKVVYASAGHSHTALLTCYGKVLTCGCDHFGQLGVEHSLKKLCKPRQITSLPSGTIIRLLDCGSCSTAMVTSQNRMYYTGLNPASLKSLISSARKKERPPEDHIADEEKDFFLPTVIDTSHMAGDIVKLNAATTHLSVMTSLGLVYTWGIGKSGQLVRQDDDSKTLELIDCEEKMIIASDVVCSGDCTFIVERDTGRLFGCGFNSSGQLGRMEADEEHSVMTIRTKKRVVKVRQPSNIYFRLREIPGLPKQVSWEGDSSYMSMHKISPPIDEVNQQLLEWALRAFRRNYDPVSLTKTCLEFNNYAAASLLQTLAENYEHALQHDLSGGGGNEKKANEAIDGYLGNVEKKKFASLDQACRFLTIVINHWAKHGLPSSHLEEILDTQRNKSPWDIYLNCAIKEIIATADDSAEWIAANLTPLFILNAIRDSQNSMPKLPDDEDIINSGNPGVNFKCESSSGGPSSSVNANTSKANGVCKSSTTKSSV